MDLTTSNATYTYQGVNDPCVICSMKGDTMYHYGAYCCNGCRCFFRRAVRCNMVWRCLKGTGSCPMPPGRKQKCKKCRMAKCLRAGMQREEVQRDRDPISSVVNRTSPINNYNNMPLVSWTVSKTKPDVELSSYSCSPIIQQAIAFHEAQRINSSSNISTADNNKAISYTVKGLLFDIAIPNVYVQLNQHANALINSAKMDTDFCSLPIRDQVSLIRSGSQIQFLFHLRKVPGLHQKIVSIQSSLSGIELKRNQFNYIRNMVESFRHSNPDPVEVAILESIVFWNWEVCESREARTVIKEKQQQFLVALENYVYSKTTEFSGKLGQMLLIPQHYERLASSARIFCREILSNPDCLTKEVFLNNVDN